MNPSQAELAPDNIGNPEDVTRVALAELVQLKNTVKGVRRPRGQSVKTPLAGGNQARALGRGLDFSEVREYQPGDDVRNIDWKVTARSGRAHTKIFHEERERPFLLAIDMRASMKFATRVAFKSVIAARLAAMLAWAASSQRDRVGGIVFNDAQIREVKPAAGSRGVTRLLNAMVSLQQSGEPSNRAHVFEDIFQHLQRTAHTGSSIVLLSDFYGCDTGNNKAAVQMLEHNHAVACRIYDPLEKTLPPPALYTITDGVSKGVVDTSARQTRAAYEALFEARSQAMQQLFSMRTSHYAECATNDSLTAVARNILRCLPGSL